MKKITFVLLLCVCNSIQAQDILSLSKVTDHVKGVVLTTRAGGSSSGKDNLFYPVLSFGFSLLIKPDNIDPPSDYNRNDFIWTVEDSVFVKEGCKKDTCWKMKRQIKSPVTLALGYEFAPSYSYLIDEQKSHFQIKGYYAGLFWNLPGRESWLGVTVELCGISDASGEVRDNAGNYIPIKYSTETTLAPELYVGTNLSKFVFMDLSWQYIHFASVSYRSAADGSYISTINNPRLRSDITINTVLLTLGVNIAGNLFKQPSQ